MAAPDEPPDSRNDPGRRQGVPSPRTVVENGDYTLEGDTLKQKVESLEKTLVKEALARHRWNQSKVARELGLSRVGLANEIRRYDLQSLQ